MENGALRFSSSSKVSASLSIDGLRRLFPIRLGPPESSKYTVLRPAGSLVSEVGRLSIRTSRCDVLPLGLVEAVDGEKTTLAVSRVALSLTSVDRGGGDVTSGVVAVESSPFAFFLGGDCAADDDSDF